MLKMIRDWIEQYREYRKTMQKFYGQNKLKCPVCRVWVVPNWHEFIEAKNGQMYHKCCYKTIDKE